MSQNQSDIATNDESQGWDAVPEYFGKDVNDYLNHYITVADAKAGAFLASSLVLGTLLVSQNYSSFGIRVLMFLSLIFLGLSALACAVVIFPRLPSGGNGLIFWEDIREHKSLDEYINELKSVSDFRLKKEYASQNYLVSYVLHDKHVWLQRAITSFGIGVVLSIFTYALFELL